MDIYEGLENENYDRKYKDGELMKRIWQCFAPYKKKMFCVIFLMIFITILEILVPIIISRAVDMISYSDDNKLVLLMCCMLLMIGIVKYIFTYFKSYMNAQVTGSVVLDLRGQLYSNLLQLDSAFFDQQLTGKIVNRVMNDTSGFANVITLLVDLMSYALIIILLTIWLIIISAYLTIPLILMMVVAILISIGFRYLARRVSSYARQSEASLSSVIQESIAGMMTAKIFRQEAMIYSDFTAINHQYYKINARKGLIFCIIYPLIAALSGVGISVLVYTGGYLFQTGKLTIGVWLLFIQAESYFWYPMMKISSFWSLFQEGLTCSERVFSLIDTKPQIFQIDSIKLEDKISEFEIIDLDFHYVGRDNLLNKFNMKINSGEKIAIVGYTGSGKTTVLRLLARYNEFQGGRILVNGKDIRTLDLYQYRMKIGIISQEPYLFSGTVRQNITYGNETANEKDIERVINTISDGEWLMDFRNGLDTEVGERGALVSAGQQQLIALARVMLKNPDVLILDEATANIDPFTEAQLQEGIQKLMNKRTVIMVAHRISTLECADRIVVLDHGEVVESGTREELLQKDGIYKNMYSKYYHLD